MNTDTDTMTLEDRLDAWYQQTDDIAGLARAAVKYAPNPYARLMWNDVCKQLDSIAAVAVAAAHDAARGVEGTDR